MNEEEEWQTVPRKPHHNRGGRRGSKGSNASSSRSRGRNDSKSQSRSRSRSKSQTRTSRRLSSGSFADSTKTSSGNNNNNNNNNEDGFELPTSNMFTIPAEAFAGINQDGSDDILGQSGITENLEGLVVNTSSGGDKRSVSFKVGDPRTSIKLYTQNKSKSGGHNDDEDDEDDGDDYDEDEDVDEESMAFPASSISVVCPFGQCNDGEEDELNRFVSASELIKHLRDSHKLCFKSLGQTVLFLQDYLNAWAQTFRQVDSDISFGVEEIIGDGSIVLQVIDPNVNIKDQAIRDDERKKALGKVLKLQEHEREKDAQEPCFCLFCTHRCQNRANQFRHMFKEHNFNIGLPDNLVDVNDFLHILEGKLNKLQCLYCEKIFTSTTVLRKHMRKKKHFKISPRNHLYDRFYVINYIETGKNWEELENEKYDSDQDKRDESWADWEEEDEGTETKSLFDDKVFKNAEECVLYTKAEYKLDIDQLREQLGLDFYGTISLINYIRSHTSAKQCFYCQQQFDTAGALVDHLKSSDCILSAADKLDVSKLKDSKYLVPVIESDPMLMMGFDDNNEDGNGDNIDESEIQKRIEENKRQLREKMGGSIPISLANTTAASSKK
ncbi:hypothetical protein H4219_003550 [Mycoemilia scoparia]|uniref:C2H2-type domain-containing protein n=1 Tax=Mycoemilia scoparia TaxID=417184 RepID=A0A9W8A0Y4_9FUNG|nr:hypothetical protein H4219_003550 [Mycoemilia scoparia]